MVLFPKGIALIFLTTSPGKAVRSVTGSGKLSTKWLKPQMQMIRVEGLNLKHNLGFDKHLALLRQVLCYDQVKAQVPLSSRMGKPSSAVAVQPPACKEKRHSSTGAAGSAVVKSPGESGATPMNAHQNYLSM